MYYSIFYKNLNSCLLYTEIVRGGAIEKGTTAPPVS